MSDNAAWSNLIAGYGEENPEELLANPFNHRIHPVMQQEAMEGALEEVGWAAPVIVNRITGHMIDGHMRVQLALRRGMTSVPVVYIDADAETELKILATYDRLGSMAVEDDRKMAELLEQLPDFRNEDFASLMEDMRERFAGPVTTPRQATDADYVPNEFEAYRDERAERGVPGQMQKVVQLFLDLQEYEEVQEIWRRLAERWGLENQTETLLEAIRRAGKMEG